MARSPKKTFRRYYWDSCSWIALIWKEMIDGENRGALCRAIIDDASNSAAEICTCALALAEVSKHPSTRNNPKEGGDKIEAFLRTTISSSFHWIGGSARWHEGICSAVTPA
jgi:predicted nucleic acid-binding protein